MRSKTLKDLSTDTGQTATMQRAKGLVRLQTARRASGESYAAVIRQESSSRVLFPQGRHTHVEAVLLNTSGGITGGDAFSVSADIGEGSALTLTTQAAERVYRSTGKVPGTLRTSLSVAEDARLHWLPQETILFDGCAFSRTLDVDLAPTAAFLMVESLIFGRTASGETVREGLFHDRVTIRRENKLVFADALRFDGPVQDILSRPAVTAGGVAMAGLVYTAPDAEHHLGNLRALLPDTAGASLIADNLLVVRAVAADSFYLRKVLVPVLNYLTQNALPKTWSL